MSVDLASFETFTQASGEEPTWLLPVAHLSPSSLGMLQRCPEQYRQRYMLGRKERPQVSMVMGSAAHSTFERNYQQKIESHVDLPLREIVDFFDDEAWPSTIEDDGGVDNIVWHSRSHDDARTTGRMMITAYHESVAVRVQPTAVEKEYRLEVDGLAVPLVGKLDVETDGPSIDVKTSSRRTTTLKPSWWLQGWIYSLFTQKHIDWHVITSVRHPETITPLESGALRQYTSPEIRENTIDTVKRLASMANALYVKFGPDEPWPTTGIAHGVCSWCGFRPNCPAWKGVT